MIGMMCQRLAEFKSKADNPDPSSLSSYDRRYENISTAGKHPLTLSTRVFLVSSAQTSVCFKYAEFRVEYITQFLWKFDGKISLDDLTRDMKDLAVPSTSNDPVITSRKTLPGKAKVHKLRPELTIFSSRNFSLRDAKQATLAARLSLGILDYLQRKGPLLSMLKDTKP